MVDQEQLIGSMSQGAESTWQPKLARTLLMLASTAVACLVAETALHVAGIAQITEYEPDPRWGYLMRPNQVVSAYGIPVAINEFGLRGPSFQAEKATDGVRVLFVGDSVTYGGGWIREPDLFCRLVESWGLSDGLAIEAINLAAPGWSPQNALAYVRANGLLDADWVVMVLPAIDLARPFSTMEQHGLRQRAPTLRLASLFLKLRALASHREGHLEPAASRLAANVEAVTALRRLADDRLLAVLIEYRPPYEQNPNWWQFESVLSNVLDLRPGLLREDFHDHVHLSSFGHRKVARHIYRRLRQLIRTANTAEGRPRS